MQTIGLPTSLINASFDAINDEITVSLGEFLERNMTGLMALYENEIVAGCFACNHAPILYISSLFVKKEYRNQKVGSTLLEKVLNDCKEYQVIRLNANIKAISLYQRYGFCQNGQIEKNLIVPMVLERK